MVNNIDTDQTVSVSETHLEAKNSTRNIDYYNPSVRLLQIPKGDDGSCGFHLSRSKWDPYPWVSGVDSNTPAELTGLKVGDCVLEVNGEDVVGLRITEVANLVKCKSDYVNLLLWTSGLDESCNPESICCGPMPLNLERLSACMQTILLAIECPVCLDTIPPPTIQCPNGHLLCAKCRIRSDRCPICRERYAPGRSLIAERIYNSVMDGFCLRNTQGKLRERLFGVAARRKMSISRSLSDVRKPIQGPANRFLAKLMGKATSLDNLSFKNGPSSNLVVENMNEIKSLSTNDITQQDNLIAIPRCPSNSNSRLGSDVNGESSLKGQLFTKRPTSLSASAEFSSANGICNSDISLVIPIPRRVEEKHFYCPADENCGKKFNSQSLQQHVTGHHKIPIVSFGTSSAEIALPPRAPIDDACLILVLDDKLFWLKLKVDNDGSIFTSALLQGFDENENGKYMIEVKIRNKVRDKLLERELITRSIVHSLTRTSWCDALEKKLGIFYDANNLRTTFIGDAELLLRIDVKCRNEK